MAERAKNGNENWSLMMSAAKQYYQLGLPQDVIAKNLFISKSTVSRLIKKSVEMGYIEFHINDFGETDEALEQEFMQTFGIKCVILPTYVDSGMVRLNDVCAFAAKEIFSNVEDDEIIARSLKKHLESWDYDVVCVEDFSDVMKEFAGTAPQLVLMDIKLPFYNGYHWCSRIREVSKVPVIFVSSASDNMNIVMAVNMGGDDFIAKPFDLDVLTAKIQALLRRTYDFAGQNTVLEHRGALLNLGDATLICGETRVDLTKNELKILQVLMENKEKIVSRDTLMTKLWESDSFVDENTLSVNVGRLRKKLDAAGLSDFILTKKGIGYHIG